ncbi:asparagine synthase C-terminal domain-containing protein, partial [Candidatus Bathyarchaeota archaeon]|nr:asparagine synthase C-terminal domain-containing protein [Candidatus Bathyarchaeota archaeon]
TKTDRMSMWHGLEVRVPLLDHKLVEFVSSLPSDLKVKGMNLKYIFKKVLRGFLPDEILDRPKAGFHVPVPIWLKGELKDLVGEFLSNRALKKQGIFEPEFVGKMVEEQIEGKERQKLILRLRKEALELMTYLSPFQPRLIGSVWRGTARKGSDIDIQVYASSIDEVQRKLGEKFQITKSEWTSKTSKGETSRFCHIFIRLQTGDEAEISVKNLADASEVEKDSVYGDNIAGLSTQELQSILRRNPIHTFVPEKKKGRREKR